MGRTPNPTIVEYTAADKLTKSYRVRVRVAGRQTTETFPSRAAAEVFRLRVMDPAIGPERAVAMRGREDVHDAAYVPTVAEMLTKHVEELTGIEDTTREDYVKIAKRSWLPRLGALRVDEVTRADVAGFVNAMAGTVAPKTIKNQHSVLSAVLESAMHAQHITHNPARGTRLPRTGEDEVDDIRFLTYAEFDLLHPEIPEHYQPFVTNLFGTGARYSEATATWQNTFDFDSQIVVDGKVLPAATLRILRAWKKSGQLGPPKSRAGRRTIWLPQEVVDTTRPLVEDLGPTALVYSTEETGVQIKHSNFYNRIWRPAVIRASICADHRAELLERDCRCMGTKPLKCQVHTEVNEKGHRIPVESCGCPNTIGLRPRIHDARHTHASWLIAQGVRLEVVQERLGHEDYTTTRRIYGHLLPDMQREAGVAAARAFAQTAIRSLPAGGPGLILPAVAEAS